MPRVSPEIMVWARETAGLTQEEAARRNQNLNDTRAASALDKLNAIEYGMAEPSRSVLTEMARVYRRPLLMFYLPVPPAVGDRGADFRTLPAERSATDDALVDALLRDLRARQIAVRALLEDIEEAERLEFVGSHRMEEGTESVVEGLRELLGVGLDEYRNQRSATAAFGLLRTGAENAGVFVLLLGNLGTHHTDIDTDMFRGFTIADDVAPFVIINHHDARPAWSFTLLHELVHLLLGQTGLSGAQSENEIERFCNDAAGEFLLPTSESASLHLPDEFDFDGTIQRISEFADQRNLSRSMVAYRARRVGLIERSTFDGLMAAFKNQWVEERSERRRLARETDSPISPHVTRRYRLGASLIELMRRSISAGEISTSKAANVLGVKPGQVGSLFEAGRRP